MSIFNHNVANVVLKQLKETGTAKNIAALGTVSKNLKKKTNKLVPRVHYFSPDGKRISHNEFKKQIPSLYSIEKLANKRCKIISNIKNDNRIKFGDIVFLPTIRNKRFNPAEWLRNKNSGIDTFFVPKFVNKNKTLINTQWNYFHGYMFPKEIQSFGVNYYMNLPRNLRYINRATYKLPLHAVNVNEPLNLETSFPPLISPYKSNKNRIPNTKLLFANKNNFMKFVKTKKFANGSSIPINTKIPNKFSFLSIGHLDIMGLDEMY